MEQKQKKIALIYGSLPSSPPPDWILIDVTNPDWLEQALKVYGVEDPKELILYCIGISLVTAYKKVPRDRLISVKDLSDLPTYESLVNPPSRPAIAKIGGVVVSKRCPSSLDEVDIWLSPYHLELIEKLLSKGNRVELLDEAGNPILEAGTTERKKA